MKDQQPAEIGTTVIEEDAQRVMVRLPDGQAVIIPKGSTDGRTELIIETATGEHQPLNVGPDGTIQLGPRTFARTDQYGTLILHTPHQSTNGLGRAAAIT